LEYVEELLSEQALLDTGYFEAGAVTRLATKAASGARLSEVEECSLIIVIAISACHHLILSITSHLSEITKGEIPLVIISSELFALKKVDNPILTFILPFNHNELDGKICQLLEKNQSTNDDPF